MTLSNKQAAFVEEYLKHFNATKAAIDAGYSPKTATNIGWENVRKREIAEAISKRLQEKTMSADEVLVRLGEQARADISDFFDVHDGLGNMFFLNLDKAKKAGKLHLIKKMKYSAAGLPELELYDAQAALVHIGKHHGLFTDNVQHSGIIEHKHVSELTDEELTRIATSGSGGTAKTQTSAA